MLGFFTPDPLVGFFDLFEEPFTSAGWSLAGVVFPFVVLGLDFGGSVFVADDSFGMVNPFLK